MTQSPGAVVNGAVVNDLTFGRSLLSLAGAAGLVLLVPFVILLIGLPIALSIRGLTEAVGWLFALISS